MTTAERVARIDTAIAADRIHYLTATWAGHDGEAQWWESEVDRLLELRTRVVRGPLATASTATTGHAPDAPTTGHDC